MLELDGAEWTNLRHAYGSAEDIPALLSELEVGFGESRESEVWDSLWSALAHQGDVYDASFAAVPHVVRILAKEPSAATFHYFQFPAWIEICRSKQGIGLSEQLAPAYRAALDRIPGLVAQATTRTLSPDLLASSLAAIAASNGNPVVAEAALELQPDVAQRFLGWFFSQ